MSNNSLKQKLANKFKVRIKVKEAKVKVKDKTNIVIQKIIREIALLKIKTRDINHIWILYYATLLHFIWGVMLLFFSSPLDASSIITYYAIFHNQYVLAVLLIMASLCAIVAMYYQDVRSYFTLLIIPQQFFLFVSAVGGLYYVYLRVFTNANLLNQFHFNHQEYLILSPIIVRYTDPWLLLAAIMPVILAAIAHFGAVVSNLARRGHYK